MADFCLRVCGNADRSCSVELQAGRGRAVHGHGGCVCCRCPVWLRQCTCGLLTVPGAGGHALDGAHPRRCLVFRHRCHGDRARRVTARRDPMGAERSAH